jgi:legumain
MKTFFAAALAAAVSAAPSDHWAVLVAGSNTYGNYRHQADVAHAYKILKSQGVPAENIIYMAYDDVANSSSNPLPGQLFNRTDGPNVYDASVVDYKGTDVTAEKFLAVLTGDSATAGGRVLESNENSNVFVYYTDHGAPNLVAFPSGGYLYADKLNDAFETMKDKKMFSELTFYMEACESGSMFPSLTSDGKIYGVTASNATESSWASYCNSEATVNGTNLGTCLGDLFSTNWMEDTDGAILAEATDSETLANQYVTVQTKTTRSPVLKFGDFSFVNEAIGEFEGVLDEQSADLWIESWLKRVPSLFESTPNDSSQHVDQRDHMLHYWTNKVMAEGGDENHAALLEEVTLRSFYDNTFRTAFPGLGAEELETELEDYDCYRFLIDSFETSCGKFNDYGFKYARYLRHTCIVGDTEHIQHTA